MSIEAEAVRDHGAAEPADPPEAAIEEFAGRVLGDLASTMITAACVLGDKVGLFRELARGPATSGELAAAAGADERCVREWASALFAAGYLGHEPASDRFSLPAAHAPVLAAEGSPAFLGGAHQVIGGMLAMLGPVEKALRGGGGVPLDAYGDDLWSGAARLTGVAFEHRLVQHWIPAVPDVEATLHRGGRVADVGCGSGVAALRLAGAFPRSRVRGFDLLATHVERASRAARQAGLDDRASFEQLDATDGIPGEHDLITLFDMVHDSRDPLRLLRAARAALAPGGACLILEVRCDEQLEGNQGPAAALLYGISLFHCAVQSIAAGGPGLGACGLPEPRLRALCLEAGFAGLERVAEEPLDVLYAART